MSEAYASIILTVSFTEHFFKSIYIYLLLVHILIKKGCDQIMPLVTKSMYTEANKK